MGATAIGDFKTIACQLTPPGRSALATVGVAGERIAEIVQAFFSPAASQQESPADPIGKVQFGCWQHTSANRLEEVVVVQSSLDLVEIHCHGGELAVKSILQTLEQAGAVLCDQQQWVHHRFQDTIQAEAVQCLAAVETERAAAILLDQIRGALRGEITAITQHLACGDTMAAVALLERLQQSGRWGVRLQRPWRVVFAGPPNAGKSSLVNALLGYSRSIVDARPGTTRDRVEVPAALDGWPVQLVDSAGLRTTADPVEFAGVSRAYEAAASADLLVWVLDVSTSNGADELPTALRGRQFVGVMNKTDLIHKGSTVPAGWLPTSARTGYGLHRLQAAIVQRLVPVTVPPGAGVVFTERQARLVAGVLDACRAESFAEAQRRAAEI